MKVRNQVNFASVPEWVLFSPLSASAVRLYAVLNRYAQGKGRCHPGRAKLRDHLQVKSVRTIDRLLAELRVFGAIDIKRRVSSQGDLTSSEYLVFALPGGAMQMSLGSDIYVSTPTDTDVATGSAIDVAPPPAPEPAVEQGKRPRKSERKESHIEVETPLPPPEVGAQRDQTRKPNPRALGTNPRAVANQIQRSRKRAIAEAHADGALGFDVHCQCGGLLHLCPNALCVAAYERVLARYTDAAETG